LNGLPAASVWASSCDRVSTFLNRSADREVEAVTPEEDFQDDDLLELATAVEVDPTASAKQPAAVATLKIQVERALM
jgi:hypothetical protein